MSIDSETGCIKFKVISLEVSCNLHTVGTTGDSLLTKTNRKQRNRKMGIQNGSLFPDPGTQQGT